MSVLRRIFIRWFIRVFGHKTRESIEPKVDVDFDIPFPKVPLTLREFGSLIVSGNAIGRGRWLRGLSVGRHSESRIWGNNKTVASGQDNKTEGVKSRQRGPYTARQDKIESTRVC